MRFDDEPAHGDPPLPLQLAIVVAARLSPYDGLRHAGTGMIDMDQEAYSELSLRELRVLSVLLQQRSITQTAQAMETTQPAISKMLRHLRAQFSDPLFVRNGGAMQPTAKALDIADRLRVLLDAADGLRSAATEFDPASSDRLFSLLLTDVGMIRFLPPLIARVAVIAPNISVRAVPLDARQFEHRLETGEADLAFGAFPKAARHLRRQRLYFDGYSSVLRKRHPRASKSRSRTGFLAERHILVTGSETGHAAHLTAQRVLSAAILPANVMLRVPSFIAGGLSRRRPMALPPCRPIWRSASPNRSVLPRSKPRSRCRGSRSPNSGMSVITVTPATNGSGTSRSNFSPIQCGNGRWLPAGCRNVAGSA
jgi:DNA-binding transcriptional LysR family regulator